jgi:predicted transcriptional regulator
MKTADYLAAVKAQLKITSDYGLAKALKISKQAASKYASGERIPGPVVAFRVAEILGEQPAAVVAIFEQERAERVADEEEASEWREWVKRLGGAAASILLAAGFGGLPNGGADLPQSGNASSLYIV